MLSFYPLLEKFVINSLFKWEIVSDRIRNRIFTQKKTGVHSPVWEAPALCIYFIAFKPLLSILSFPRHI